MLVAMTAGDFGEHATVGVGVLVHGQTYLPHVIRALRPAGRPARRLHSGQQQADHDAYNGDDDQKLDESERTSGAHGSLLAGAVRPAGRSKGGVRRWAFGA